MVLKFQGNFTKSKKADILKFIDVRMSVSSRVRQFAFDEDIETICTVTQGGEEGTDPYFSCELQCEERTYDNGNPTGWRRKKCGRVVVQENGRAKWQSGPSYADEGKHAK